MHARYTLNVTLVIINRQVRKTNAGRKRIKAKLGPVVQDYGVAESKWSRAGCH